MLEVDPKIVIISGVYPGIAMDELSQNMSTVIATIKEKIIPSPPITCRATIGKLVKEKMLSSKYLIFFRKVQPLFPCLRLILSYSTTLR